ncbi:MAG TPA: hypothetical protein VEH84_04285 [Alphaproteobacteria bacterium]|nr:hypothetical protein [Alphaproteobacteria bacterium]
MPRIARLAAIALFALPAAAQAEDLVFRLNNSSDLVLTELYVSPSEQTSWGEDILGRDVLSPGEAGDVTIADGESTCVYDIRFVGEGGATLEEEEIDLCQLREYTLN